MSTSLWFKSSYSSMPDYFQEGDVRILSGLRDLEMCVAKVKSVSIYQTPLQQSPLQALEVINHHFLVVDVSSLLHPTQGEMRGLTIHAEKTGRDTEGENTGITVKEIKYVTESRSILRHCMDDLGVSIPMNQLLRILTAHNPHYDLFSDNCWKYADTTLRRPVRDLVSADPVRPAGNGDHAFSVRLEEIPAPVMPGTVIGYGILGSVAAYATMFVYKKLSGYAREEAREENR